ncbi:MAG: hypothetical protein K1W28_06335 [Lachnospiraceae bacterium]
MERREKRLWIRALCGRKDAYRMLGVRYLKRGTDRRDRKLAKLCLEKAMELGDEIAYLLYHHLFSKGKQVIDDRSYEAFWQQYRKSRSCSERRRLEKYLRLGTDRQKKRLYRAVQSRIRK